MGSSEAQSSPLVVNDALIQPVCKAGCMHGGSGEDSYANNSRLQNYNFHAFAKPHLAEAVDFLFQRSPAAAKAIRMADFGCSHGRNTLEYAAFIVDRVLERCDVATEIQYFFSDLPTNDFNNLFQTLMPISSAERDKELRKFFVAGVPGSFHSQLLPRSSLDFAVCSFSLHWLSQIPQPVEDKSSLAWNGGHVWIHGERPKAAEAYAQQFQSDAQNFLKCRAEELSKGGVLFLFAISRAEEKPVGSYMYLNDPWCGFFESTWNEMVSEGLVTAEERDMFNTPLYTVHRSELEQAVQAVPELELLKVQVMEGCPNLPEDEIQQLLSDPIRFGQYWGGLMKSLANSMVQTHIGEERATEFFKRLQRIATENSSLTTCFLLDTLVAIIRRT